VRLLVAGGELLRRGGLNAGGGGGQHQVASGELEQPHLALQLQDLAEKTESGGTWHSLWRSRRRNSIRHGAELLKSAAQPEPGEEPGTTRCRSAQQGPTAGEIPKSLAHLARPNVAALRPPPCKGKAAEAD
jgi:hypothetical protein